MHTVTHQPPSVGWSPTPGPTAVTPNRRRLPPNRRRLPPNRRRLPINRRRLPPNRRRLPTNRRRLPINRRRLPPNRRRLPPNRRRLPPDRRRLPPNGALSRYNAHGDPPPKGPARHCLWLRGVCVDTALVRATGRIVPVFCRAFPVVVAQGAGSREVRTTAARHRLFTDTLPPPARRAVPQA